MRFFFVTLTSKGVSMQIRSNRDAFEERPATYDTIHRLFLNTYGFVDAWKKSRLHIFSLRRLHQRRSLSGAILSPGRRRMQRDTREDTRVAYIREITVFELIDHIVPQFVVPFSQWWKSICSFRNDRQRRIDRNFLRRDKFIFSFHVLYKVIVILEFVSPYFIFINLLFIIFRILSNY